MGRRLAECGRAVVARRAAPGRLRVIHAHVVEACFDMASCASAGRAGVIERLAQRLRIVVARLASLWCSLESTCRVAAFAIDESMRTVERERGATVVDAMAGLLRKRRRRIQRQRQHNAASEPIEKRRHDLTISCLAVANVTAVRCL